ncbi:3'-5' exonuclease [Acinetobacter bereziniae]|uniref:3'-5' exonuclease n=1 Tax=Acinetobacter bereziniae TaxID=106648 RepID=UPI003018313D
MSAYIADTETNTLSGYPIEIAYVPCSFNDGLIHVDGDKVYDEYFSCPQPISFGAMAVHHILEKDIADKPSYETFKAPDDCEYLIGHNIDYDIKVLNLGIPDFKPKAICTLALSRMAWPDADAHNISALIYRITNGSEKARERIRNAHNAKTDILLTATILKKLCEKLAIRDMASLYQMSEIARIPKIITFGKHRGEAIKDLPKDYLCWLLKQPELDPYLEKALNKALRA